MFKHTVARLRLAGVSLIWGIYHRKGWREWRKEGKGNKSFLRVKFYEDFRVASVQSLLGINDFRRVNTKKRVSVQLSVHPKTQSYQGVGLY